MRMINIPACAYKVQRLKTKEKFRGGVHFHHQSTPLNFSKVYGLIAWILVNRLDQSRQEKMSADKINIRKTVTILISMRPEVDPSVLTALNHLYQDTKARPATKAIFDVTKISSSMW